MLIASIDSEDWIIGRCDRVGGSRGSSCLLLPSARSESSGLLLDIAALQGRFLFTSYAVVGASTVELRIVADQKLLIMQIKPI